MEGDPSRRAWLNRTTLGVSAASLFSDVSHELATAVLPAFLVALGAGPSALGWIEGGADGLSAVAKLWGAANSLTMLDKLIDATIDYARERKVFGKPVLDNQIVHFRLAELRTEVEALRSLTWRAVEDYVAGKDVTKLASMAKLKCGRLIREVADSCLQYWGGMGYTWDNPLSRALRDGRLVSIGGGADEIMLGIICKLEGTLPPKKKDEPREPAERAFA